MHLLLDIGGTKLRITTTNDSGSFDKPTIYPTPQDFDEAMQLIEKYITQHLSSTTADIDQIIVAIPGILKPDGSGTVNLRNLPQWNNQPFLSQISKLTSGSVHVFNDADIAGLGEAVSGAGQDYSIVAYLTVSTGLGGTRIVNQQFDNASIGFEPGHQIIDASGQLCPDCDTPTTLEHLVGGANVESRYQTKPANIKDEQVWDTMAHYLALGLNNIMLLWSPHVIILGGPMMNDIKIDQVKRYLTQVLTIKRDIPDIKLASLGDDRAFHGALAYLKQLPPDTQQ